MFRAVSGGVPQIFLDFRIGLPEIMTPPEKTSHFSATETAAKEPGSVLDGTRMFFEPFYMVSVGGIDMRDERAIFQLLRLLDAKLGIGG